MSAAEVFSWLAIGASAVTLVICAFTIRALRKDRERGRWG